MTKIITTPCLPQSEIETTEQLFDNWFDPIEAGLRDRVHDCPEVTFEGELDEALLRPFVQKQSVLAARATSTRQLRSVGSVKFRRVVADGGVPRREAHRSPR